MGGIVRVCGIVRAPSNLQQTKTIERATAEILVTFYFESDKKERQFGNYSFFGQQSLVRPESAGKNV